LPKNTLSSVADSMIVNNDGKFRSRSVIFLFSSCPPTPFFVHFFTSHKPFDPHLIMLVHFSFETGANASQQGGEGGSVFSFANGDPQQLAPTVVEFDDSLSALWKQLRL